MAKQHLITSSVWRVKWVDGEGGKHIIIMTKHPWENKRAVEVCINTSLLKRRGQRLISVKSGKALVPNPLLA